MAAFNPSICELTSFPACLEFRTSIAWFCTVRAESVHAFRSSADLAPVRTRSPRIWPAPLDVPRSLFVVPSSFFTDASSFCALSLSSSALLFSVKLMTAKINAPTNSTPATMKRISQMLPPPLLGGAAPGAAAGGGADGGPGGGAGGGPGGGAGGVVVLRGAPSFLAFLPSSAAGGLHMYRDVKMG